MAAPTLNGTGDLRTRVQTAFLAAAYGDALGWPNESRGKMVLKKPKSPPSPTMVSWSRRDGMRAQAHWEKLEPGTYSDDTQLIAAVARSLTTSGDNYWWERFTRVELPFWRTYQRGAGAAVLRAAKAWGDGKPPWRLAAKEYYAAGGNGVAMRVLPHVVWHCRDGYEKVHRNVILDGITTHGHPRALMGATLFAYVLWHMLRRAGSLPFGEMVEIAISGADQWGLEPTSALTTKFNSDVASWSKPPDFSKTWSTTRTEVLDLLKIARNAMEQGALFVDHPTLERLGALSLQRGSGTISAVSAIFLASRHATDPSHGVVEAANAMGADTDTLASMTATLLATVMEGDTLAYRARAVQDHDFLQQLASQVVDKEKLVVRPVDVSEFVTNQRATRWVTALHKRKEGDPVDLLDGRSGVVRRREARRERELDIVETLMASFDGQTLRFKKVDKAREREANTMFDNSPIFNLPALAHEAPSTSESYAFAPEIVLRCRDLEATVAFYERTLGLRIFEDRRSRPQPHVRIEGALTFVQARTPSEISSQRGTEIRLRTRNADGLLERITRNATLGTISIEEREGRQVVVATDPDGRLLVIVPIR